MSSTTHTNFAAATTDTAGTTAVEVQRMLPAEVAEQRITFADILARRRGDTRPGLLFEDHLEPLLRAASTSSA